MTPASARAVETFRSLVEARAQTNARPDLSVLTRDAITAIDVAGATSALLPLWAACRSGEDDALVVRLASFLIAKYTPDLEGDRWLPMLWLLTPPFPHDESTLQNSLTALQEHPRLSGFPLQALRLEIGPLLLHALTASEDLIESVMDVLFAYLDAKKLAHVLTTRGARSLRDRLKSLPKSFPDAVVQSAASLADSMGSLSYADEFPSVAADLRRLAAARSTPSGKSDWTQVLRWTELAASDFLDRYAALEELTAEAAERNVPTQEIRVSGRWATVGKLPIDFLEKILHTWRRLYTDVRSSIGTDPPTASLFVLAPARGSFVVRVLVDVEESDFARDTRTAETLASVSESLPNGESVDVTKWPHDYAPLLRLAADQEVDLEIGMVVPGPSGARHRIRLSHGRARSAIAALSSGEGPSTARQEVIGILEGANHRTGKFEMLPEAGGTAIAGTVVRQGKSILLDKTIGGSYRFDLSRASEAVTGTEKWELHGLAGIHGEAAAATSPTREVLAPLPSVITSAVLPQTDSLARITQVVEVVASGAAVTPETIDLSKRHIAYHKQAARCLHLLSDEGTLLPAGATLVALPKPRRLEHLAIQFEVSVCGHAWMAWINVTCVDDLDPDTAFDFLRARSDLGEAMIERRGRTLRRWAKDLRGRHDTSDSER